MNWITSNLAIGGIDDCSVEKRSALQQEGIDIVLDVRHLFTVPTDTDDCTPIFPNMWKYVRLINDLTRMKWRIMIHCTAGIDRAPFVATLFVWMHKCVPMEEAYRLVTERRPQSIEHWDWIKLARESLEDV